MEFIVSVRIIYTQYSFLLIVNNLINILQDQIVLFLLLYTFQFLYSANDLIFFFDTLFYEVPYVLYRIKIRGIARLT